MPIAAVVADANVLLSAAIGKAALRVLVNYDVKVHATRFNCDEVEEYLPILATKYKLSAEIVDTQWRLLPIEVHEERSYARHLVAARSKVEGRDPDDVHPLALAMGLSLPLWTNDKDLEGHGVVCLPTAKLLRILEEQPAK